MTQIRSLKSKEQSESWKVFQTSIIYNSVRIADDLGLQSRPWCSPPGWGGLNFFCLHVGPGRFKGNMGHDCPGLLIHEMVHVWQGQRNIPFWYVLNSGCNQVISMAGSGSSNGAYGVDSEPQHQWKDYGAEQQATIVEGWYLSEMSSFDWRFRYIRDNVRTGSPWALSQPIAPPPPTTPVQTSNLQTLMNINYERRVTW